MDRDIPEVEREDERPAPPKAAPHTASGNPSTVPGVEPELGVDRDSNRREREAIPDRLRECRLNLDQRDAIEVIGKFRIVNEDDLKQYVYSGNTAGLRQDLRQLVHEGLAERKTVWLSHTGEKHAVIALTPEGRGLAKDLKPGDARQVYYSGFVKRKEMLHDAAIYPMFVKEQARLLKEGSRVTRAVLDFELKKVIYSPLITARAQGQVQFVKRQKELADEHHLKVVNGHIVLPDLRVEYVTREGEQKQVDLEVASGSYHGSHAAEKAQAGFRIYADSVTAGRLSAALEDRDIMAEIFSL